ncbi:hypothetical protein AGMMS49593_07610 [Endomicrobiia bacterium]|nr:hypothetical protein AGMMS49593_07610 [Endomicrobiia bacterium]
MKLKTMLSALVLFGFVLCSCIDSYKGKGDDDMSSSYKKCPKSGR